MNEQSANQGLTFELFLKSYKPHVRTDGHRERMIDGFKLEADFFSAFRLLKPYLASDKGDWGDDIVQYLTVSGALGDGFSEADGLKMRSLYSLHARAFRIGVFDEAYLDSIEDLALFFAYHDVKTLFIAGAYRQLTQRLIDLICDRAGLNRRVPLRTLMKALVSALSVELNQIQRTFTLYERYVSESLVADLSFGGILTGMPTGKPGVPGLGLGLAASPLGGVPTAVPNVSDASDATQSAEEDASEVDDKPWRKARSVHAMIDSEESS